VSRNAFCRRVFDNKQVGEVVGSQGGQDVRHQSLVVVDDSSDVCGRQAAVTGPGK
jgi:hypothetical protein